jgi:Platelet-activating factor acetylhydrolase, isoform II
MRLFEVILIATLLAAAIAQITKSAAAWSRPLTVLAALVALWHIIHEGTHWQMFPVLAGLILLAVWQLISASHRTSRYAAAKNPVVVAVVLLSIVSFGMLLIVPMFTLPKPTGTYLVGTRIVYLKDPNRTEDKAAMPGTPRELMVQFWYPADPSNNPLAAYERLSETIPVTSYRSVLWTNSREAAPVATQGGPFHVLLFNHAWGGRRTQDTFLTEDLASHGYVVASIDHTYNTSRVVLPGDRVIDYTDGGDAIDPSLHSASEVIATWNKELTKWVADEVFVLNTLQSDNLDPKSPWYGRLDTQRAGALGHSFGGAAAVQLCSVDARIQSALNMDGWTFGDLRQRAANQPTMFLYGITNIAGPQNPGVGRAEAELDTTDSKEVDTSLKQFGGYKLSIRNTSHMDFTDHPLVSPWRSWMQPGHISPVRIQTIVRAYVLAFFDQTVRGANPPLLQPGTSSPYHEVQIGHWSPESKPASAQ